MSDELVKVFLLTRQSRDASRGLEYVFWAASDRGPLRIVVTGQECVFFVDRTVRNVPGRRVELELVSLGGAPVDGLYFKSRREMRGARDSLTARGIATYESDIKPEDRFLMERFVTGAFSVEGKCRKRDGYLEFTNPKFHKAEYRPRFTVASLDIETGEDNNSVLSIAVASADSERIFVHGPGPDSGNIAFLPYERALLAACFDWIAELDPDIIVGWNVVGFDLTIIERSCAQLGLEFTLGRGGERAVVLPPMGSGQVHIARVPGRAVLDGIDMLRTAMYKLESFSLDNVAVEMLGRGKLISHDVDRRKEIERLFREDKPALAEYNIEDCRLVLDIFDKTDLFGFATERTELTGLALGRQGGSVAAFDYLYLPRLHRHGRVAPDLGPEHDIESSPGGHVMDSQPGFYDNVVVLDFKSLYPSIIRTFKIDPLGMAEPGDNPIRGYGDAAFSRETHILPGIVETLWAARDDAKSRRDMPMSQAIKILMNSFYGVLGTSGCRFSSPKLAGSVTRFGYMIITRSKEFIETRGLPVIYGDTDSLFVLMGVDVGEDAAAGMGEELADALNVWWREVLRREFDVESWLEAEFDAHYLKFLMPTVRGSTKGSKKRYAGLVRAASGELDVEFTGLETVRSDWTPLARSFQRELYRRIFLEEPYRDYVRTVAHDLQTGALDDQLVYRKRLRKRVGEYTRNVPPHVRAARLLDHPGHAVSYVITVRGPEPVEKITAPLDYAHYLERQLAPVADGVLHFLGTSFSDLTDPQLRMFD